MFSTSTSQGQSEVNMLHGTVNFETPDNQTSQITAGQSQQILGSQAAGGKYQLGQRQALNPAGSETFFNHAGGLLEHASGYGVVRRGLGPDTIKVLQERGFKLSENIRQRFQKAAQMRFKNRPVFNRMHGAHASGAGPTDKNKTTALQPTHPANPEARQPIRRPLREEAGGRRKEKESGQ